MNRPHGMSEALFKLLKAQLPEEKLSRVVGLFHLLRGSARYLTADVDPNSLLALVVLEAIDVNPWNFKAESQPKPELPPLDEKIVAKLNSPQEFYREAEIAKIAILIADHYNFREDWEIVAICQEFDVHNFERARIPRGTWNNALQAANIAGRLHPLLQKVLETLREPKLLITILELKPKPAF